VTMWQNKPIWLKLVSVVALPILGCVGCAVTQAWW
jgi:hypothetical protein